MGRNQLPLEFRLARKEAIAKGKKTYKGRPCKRGHSGVRTLAGICPECARLYQKNNYEKRNAIALAWSKNNVMASRYHSARSRAKKRGLEFDLVLEELICPEVCPVLGIPMTQPSLDRWDNALGYTKDNVRVISWQANSMKRDLTFEQVAALYRYMQPE